jgi:hypothetical protein
MRRCVSCGESNLGESYPDDIHVCRTCDLKRHRADLEQLTPERFVAESGWRLATTMLDSPHQYTVRDLSNSDAHRTTAMGHAEFECFARLTLDQGTPHRWGARTYTYYELEGWQYWTMGLAPEATTIINRRAASPDAEQVLCEQVAKARLRRKSG